MNLDPRDRKSWQGFIDLLQPPVGYRLTAAVGTSFGLTFDALTAALLSMCDTDGDALASDPVAGVIAATRLRTRVRVLVHPGTISGAPRGGTSRFIAMLDRLIVEVEPAAGLFHPKVWALRFERVGSPSAAPDEIGRVVVCSRNLTNSTCFELSAVLEGKPAQGDDPASPFSADVGDALQAWLGSAKKPVSQDVLQLPRFLRRIALDVPHEGADDLRFRWQGQGRSPLAKGLPQRVKRAIVVSPFVRPDFVSDIVSRTQQLHLVSTPECLDALDDVTFESLEALRAAQGLPVLYQVTDHGDPDGGFIDSIHAKLLLLEDARGNTTTFIGSANATGPGWGISGAPNVEAMAEMRPGIGIDRFVGAFIRENKTKVHPWIMEYDRSSRTEPDATKEAERQILAALREVARLDLSLSYEAGRQKLIVSKVSKKSVASKRLSEDPNLEFEFSPLLLSDRTDAWHSIQRLASGPCHFDDVPVEKVTAFVALRARSKQPPLERVRLVLARLDVSEADLDRRDDAVRLDIIATADPAAVLSALVQGLGYFRPGSTLRAGERGHQNLSIRQLLQETTLERLLQAVALEPNLVSEMRLLLGPIGGSHFQSLCDDLEEVMRRIVAEVEA